MAYYRTCPHCGANLDPGERCDCRAALEAEAMELVRALPPEKTAEIMENMKKAPVSAANTNRGGVDQIKRSVSTSYDSRNERGFQE